MHNYFDVIELASGVPLGEILAGFSFSCNKKKNETNNPQYGEKMSYTSTVVQ